MQCVSIIIYLFHFMCDRGSLGGRPGEGSMKRAQYNLIKYGKKAGIKVFVRL